MRGILWGRMALSLALLVVFGGVARSQGTLAEVNSLRWQIAQLIQEGRHREAIPLAERALAIVKKTLEPNDLNVAIGLNDLAGLYGHLGEYSRAEPLLKQALVIREKALPPDDPRVAFGLSNLAELYQALGEYSRAEPLYRRALAIMEKASPSNALLLVAGLINVAAFYHRLGDHARAEELLKRALTIAEKSPDSDHPAVAAGLNNLATLYRDQGDHAQTESLYRRALAIFRQALGKNHPVVAGIEENIGLLYLVQGRPEEANEIFRRIKTPTGLGRYYLRVGNHSQARPHFTRSREEAMARGETDSLIAALIGLGLAHEGLKEYKEAAQAFEEAVTRMEDQRAALPPADRTHFLAGEVGAGFKRIEAYEGLVRVCVKRGDAAQALYWAEHTKARRFLEQVSARPDRPRPGLPAALAKEEAELTTRLTGLLRSREAAQGTNPALVKQLDEKDLPQAKQALAAFVTKLRQSHPAYAAVQYPQPLPVSALTLHPQEALLVYEVTESATLAWVVRGGQVVKAHTVPVSRQDLTKQVKQYRGFFEVPQEGLTPAHLAKFDPKLGQALYEQLVKPLLANLPPGTQLIIVPDEILGILPFEALVVEVPAKPAVTQGRYGSVPQGITYLGDRYPITYAHSATALHLARTLRPAGAGTKGKLLVVADPVFEATDARLRGKAEVAATRDLYQVGLMRAVEDYQKGAATGGRLFERLTRTGQLADRLQRLYAPQVEVLTGLAAAEPTFRQRPLATYGAVVLATHGILDGEVPYIKEPALVLSQVGTNPQDRSQDGFLTLSEVLDLKLNAEVVALPACSTGVGKQLTGEGVMGLGRAFQYAGAKAVLMSLWSVEEASTIELTAHFFRLLHQGQRPSDALRQARSALRQAGYEHPFFWAPFILVGE